MSGTKTLDETLLESNVGKIKRVILHNDDYNTFNWVITSLVEVCDHDFEQAEQCAHIVHFKGKCDVKSGPEEKMSSIKKSLQNRGLSVTLED